MRNVRIATLAAVGILIIAAAVAVVETRQARQRASPHESVSATVDGSEMTIVYGRPYMRGRTIFGRLIPWDRVWCPGADEATTLDSTPPVASRQPDGPGRPAYDLDPADARHVDAGRQQGIERLPHQLQFVRRSRPHRDAEAQP